MTRLSFLSEALPLFDTAPCALLLSGGPVAAGSAQAAFLRLDRSWSLYPGEEDAARIVIRGPTGEPIAREDARDPLARLEGELAHPSVGGRYVGGAVGYFRYELVRLLQPGLVWERPLDPNVPLAQWFFFRAGLTRSEAEGATRRWGDLPEAPATHAALARLGLSAHLADIRPQALPNPYPLQAQAALERIAAGEIYQLNLGQPYQARLVGDPLAYALRLHAANPTGYTLFLDTGERRLISTSPELFLKRQEDRIVTRPIKGTRPRGATAQEDAALKAALESNAKERAELTMIVDLMRNDLGRVCQPGEVEVVSHGEIESYRNVHHRVALIEGRLRPNVELANLMRATFPPGSVTGCPKIRAMKWMDHLEGGQPRGLFAGALGWLGADGNFTLSVGIRLLEEQAGGVVYQVGSGIVADSDPLAEEAETRQKAAPLGERVEGPLYWEDGQWRLGSPTLGKAPVGIFETLRGERGHLRFANRHRQRLETSARALGYAVPDWDWEGEAERLLVANGLQDGIARARVSLRALEGPTCSLRIETAPVQPPAQPWTLYPVVTPLDAQARHKRLDRRLYNAALERAQANGAEEALLVSPEGWVCEGARSNLFWWEGETLCHPNPELPQLPGVMGGVVLEAARALNIPVSPRFAGPEEIGQSEGLFVTNAVIGLHPARCWGLPYREQARTNALAEAVSRIVD